ncbi:hypothetical protein [Hymenobacter sp. DG01]|uniref:hypothetical protein n=1 Tax=Hymenobacter sp. DG01 TaxID=2584940 RepID=UPI001123AD32|nr:hypothetical protein [Hymenobacter sp. DG01]
MLTPLVAAINATSSPWTRVSAYLDRTSPYACPFMVNELNAAGLLDVVTDLQGSRPQRKAQAYARLLARGLVYGEEQIDQIAHVQTRIREIQQLLLTLDPAELTQWQKAAVELQELVARVQEYFRD